MTRYGSLNRRSGGAAWQWVILGLVLGFACSATLVLGAIALGYLGISTDGGTFVGLGPTQTPFVITVTPAPVTPTLTPTEVIVTATPVEAMVVQAPSATPTTNPTDLVPTGTSTVTPTTTTRPETGSANPLGSDSIPSVLSSVAGEMRDVAGGTFQMGTTAAEVAAAVRQCVDVDGGQCTPAFAEDSYPQHAVVVSPFRMEVAEVTYEQYITFLNYLGPNSHANGCDGQPCLATRLESETSNVQYDTANYDVPDVINGLPVVEVTWFGAKAYCEAIGRRLPSEAEWERAARGDDGRIYPWGNNWDASLAWTNRSAPDDGEEGGPVTVESYAAGSGPYGMLNMAGNVAEWVSDWYDPAFYAQPEASEPDPIGPPLGDERVVRGGSWDAVPFFSRAMHRQSRRPGDPTPWIGFRCAADPETATNRPAGGTANTAPSPIAPIGTPNPATLGNNVPNDEGDLGGAAPALPPTVGAPAQVITPTTPGLASS